MTMNIELESIKAADVAMKIPGQIRRTEAAYLYRLARQKGPLVEIGCLHGRSTAVLLQAAKVFGAKVTSIDPFLPTPNTMVSSQAFWRQNLNDVKLVPQEIYELMSEDAAPLYKDKIGLLFVDGGHTYEDVKTDIACWADKVKVNGIIAFHDMFQYAIPGVARAIVEWWSGEFSHSKVAKDGLAKWRLLGQVDFLIAFRRVA